MNLTLSEPFRRLRTAFVACLIGGGSLLTTPATACASSLLWEADFTQAPYVSGNSLIGTGEWAGTAASGNEMDASIVSDADGQQLLIVSSRTGSGSSTSVNHAFEGPITGEKIRLEYIMAFSNPGGDGTSAAAALWFNRVDGFQNSPLVIGYAPSDSEGGGIFYNNTGAGNVTLVSRSNVSQGEYYRFIIDLDFSMRTFSIALSLLDSPQEPIVQLDNLAFRSGADVSLNSIYLSNQRGDRIAWELQSVKIAAIPEPGAVALLGVVGVVLGFRPFFGKRNL